MTLNVLWKKIAQTIDVYDGFVEKGVISNFA